VSSIWRIQNQNLQFKIWFSACCFSFHFHFKCCLQLLLGESWYDPTIMGPVPPYDQIIGILLQTFRHFIKFATELFIFLSSIIFLFSCHFLPVFWPFLGCSIMVNSIYLGILLFSIYGIVPNFSIRKQGHRCDIDFVIPVVSKLQLEYLIDFALIAMVSLTIYFLIACDYFRNRNYSLMFGIALALSMLTKWTAIIFIIGPLVYIISKAFIVSQKAIADLFLISSKNLTFYIL